MMYNRTTVSLPEDGKVTGDVEIMWVHGNRAYVQSKDYVTFRNKEWRIHARFGRRDDGTWEFLSDGTTATESRNNRTIYSDTPRTFGPVLLDACAAVLQKEWTVDIGRKANREKAEEDRDRAERRIAELREQLAEVEAEYAAAVEWVELFTE